jgi:hydrophobic/amphiphilic exporter-1 (mainly G- bacteria), HAE1 family
MWAIPNSVPRTIRTTSITTDANRSASLSCQLSTANALDVHQKCVAELDRLAKRFPPGMKYEIAFDTTDAVGESIRDVLVTVGSAILLVILVIFVFLGDWRTTIIHFIATPVSLIGTFTFIKLLGFSINTLTLLALRWRPGWSSTT